MKKPVLVLDGKEYVAKQPKAKIWRIMLQFEEDKKDIDISLFITAHCDILSELFGVDSGEIEDKAALEDIVTTYQQCFSYVMSLITKKTNELPDDNSKNA